MNSGDHIWLSVRCCCQPQKVLGFLRLPITSHNHRVLDIHGAAHWVQVRRFSEMQPHREMSESLTPYTAVGEVAIYSDDRPIEFWRTIVGFIEAGQTVR